MKLPDVIQKDKVYQGYFDLHVDRLRAETGEEITYTYLDIKAHATAVLARTQDKKLVVIREYRYPTRQWIWGCPGGRMDHGESCLQTGPRELLEETGYGGGKSLLLGSVFALPAVADQLIHYLFIDGVEKHSEPSHEPFEKIQVELKTASELLACIKKGEAVDGILCTALLLAKDQWMD